MPDPIPLGDLLFCVWSGDVLNIEDEAHGVYIELEPDAQAALLEVLKRGQPKGDPTP